jgi:nucleotide-binding universal stress UspA family protein
MFESILLPTDGSQDMTSVVDQTLELASLCDAEIHVLHVVDQRAYLSVPEDAREQVREMLEQDGQSFTKSVAKRALDAGLEVVRELRWGDPAPAILSYAVENDIDVIVMGTHGRTGYERYLLGSVAEKVVRIAPIPVLTIAVGDTDQQVEDILQAPTADLDTTDDSETTASVEREPEEPHSTEDL